MMREKQAYIDFIYVTGFCFLFSFFYKTNVWQLIVRRFQYFLSLSTDLKKIFSQKHVLLIVTEFTLFCQVDKMCQS